MEYIEGNKDFSNGPTIITYEDLKYCSVHFVAIKKLLELDNQLNEKITCILKNGPIISSAVGFQLRNALNQSPNYLQTLLSKKFLKICCLGGGPASDIVAIVTALESMSKQKGIQLDFRITVVDSDKNWKNTCITVLSRLEQFHKKTWKINFIQADVSEIKSYPPQLHEAIQEADIVTMVMLLSKSNGSINKETAIGGILKPQSMLFLLDTSWMEIRPQFYVYPVEIDGFQLIYEELCDFTAIDIIAYKKAQLKYEKYFGDVRSNICLNAFVRVWLKDLEKGENTDTLLPRFQVNLEKCNPLQSSLSMDWFEEWKIAQIEEKMNAGWHPKCINLFTKWHKNFRRKLSNELIKQKEVVERTSAELLHKNRLKICTSKTTDEVWKKYLVEKEKFATTKRISYIFVNFCNNLKIK
ncbi:uncharacterized protein CEXT_715461 [Caerostris extrusa]|uniref:Uncharacterized protein n=1 Tax=Caerostris extrusa TaxID=172846 RepID=A0AAV4X2U9_CAEEX|nr:uncharacterized protein CEXT_715461 [Caerostris extrusa]